MNSNIAATSTGDASEADIRTQIQDKLQAAYDAQLQAALQNAETNMNATEQSDLATLRQTLTQQITSQLQAGCITFSDGSYFCENTASDTAGSYGTPTPYFSAYAAKDARGYQQIFVQDGSQISQITKTNFDNIQPVVNKDDSLIAWQGLVNDRWQIFAYDRTTGVTTQLTTGEGSNINPAIDGRELAWQGWDAAENNWEIFFAAPNGTADGWSTKEITHDPWAHVGPELAGGLLAWQEYRNWTWQIFADDLSSGVISEVSAGSGTNTNPKFLLAWTNEASGTAAAYAYDIASGQVSPLAAPAPVAPASIPQPPANKNNATLPAEGASTSTTSGASSTKLQGSGDPLAE